MKTKKMNWPAWVTLAILTVWISFLIAVSVCSCKPRVIYIPGDDETSQVVYFIEEGQASPINGIVMSKAKFMRFAKRAKMDVVEREIITIEPVGDN